ncbi:hypothetical protein [Stenotrophomonas sp. MMGLT7]|uniref:hypothetical protein n=1 Tax=Stenotrophomonas sp. MMGLT7 TaxID=2901227 RepID=UPI001E42877A|nr:hypothetical protein [Stenotrophomonas sp. MMGLT7]MCD7099580.1 hypothetical protein [Stenotrophomonas sp. MMGLT7]
MTLAPAALTGIGVVAGDHARAAMLLALMDGRAYAASGLVRVATAALQTANSHLRGLGDAGLVAVQRDASATIAWHRRR